MADIFIEDLASRLRLLQFREVQHRDSMPAGNGRWRHQPFWTVRDLIEMIEA